jgi:hypothetical protein
VNIYSGTRGKIMDTLRLLILLIGFIASGIIFALMRYPQARRPQFRNMGRFSLAGALTGSLIMFTAFAAIAYMQGR